MPLETLLKSMDGFMALVDSLSEMHFLGGEPFLYKGFASVLERAISYPQIKRILILSNGTLPIRDDRLMELLKSDNRILIRVSDYGDKG